MFSGYIWSYEHIAKRIKLFRGREVMDLTPFNIDSPLYNSKQVGPTPESNSIFQYIFGPKRVLVPKSKHFRFRSKKFWVQKISNLICLSHPNFYESI